MHPHLAQGTFIIGSASGVATAPTMASGYHPWHYHYSNYDSFVLQETLFGQLLA